MRSAINRLTAVGTPVPPTSSTYAEVVAGSAVSQGTVARGLFIGGIG
jgi:hypothetical protein